MTMFIQARLLPSLISGVSTTRLKVRFALLVLAFVFLILAALYESWSLPFSVLLTVLIAVFGGLAGLLLRG